MPRWEEYQRSKTKKITNMFHAQPTKDSSGIEAEVTWVNFLVEHGVALLASKHSSKLFRKMFPDSHIYI